MNVLDRLGGSLKAPQPRAPEDSEIVRGSPIQLRWNPAPAQRVGAPVRYTVFCRDARGRIDSLATDYTSVSVPASVDGSPYHWWVRAASDWGLTAMSASRTFGVRAGAPEDRPPLLSLSPQPDRLDIQVWMDSVTRGKVDIFDVGGRCVRRFERSFDQGLTRIDWDLRDGAGHAVASGVYFVSLEAGARRASHKFALVR